MTRFALPLIALGALGAPANAASVEIESDGPVVELTVTETVAADPDIATLSAGVTTVAPTAVEALRQNSAQMDRMIAQIEAQGVDEDDIQTTGVNLNAEYDWDDQTRQQRFRGYRVSNRVTIKLRDVPRTGRVLDALVAAGATDLGGISWSIDDAEPAQAQARKAAFAKGREQALSFAQMAGYANVRLLEVNETMTQGRPIVMDVAESAAVRNQSAPIRPGQVQTGVTITVKYEMTE